MSLPIFTFINANTVVERGCIISVGASVDHDVVLEECVHVNAGAIIKSGAHVESNYKVEAGEIIQGYWFVNVKIGSDKE